MDTADAALLESTLAKLSEMVCRRLREHGLFARTVQLKLRYTDFTTLTRAHSLDHATALDTEVFREARALFQGNWKPGAPVRLVGVHASSLETDEGQMSLLDEDSTGRWRKALSAMDHLRDRFGESAVSLGTAARGSYKEKTHENPAGLPGKRPHRGR